MRGSRVGATILKEFRQFVRDPVLLVLVLWLYTIEVVICATALSFELRDERIGVLDLDRSTPSRELADRFDRSETFAVRYLPTSEREAWALLDGGQARLVVVLPPGYGEGLRAVGSAEAQLVVDGTNSLVATTALGQARALIAAANLELVQDKPTLPHPLPVVENRSRVWYNPGLRYVYSVVISMIALAGYMVGVILPAAAIVREKERGTMEQLVVSPLRPLELLVAKAVPTMVIGLAALGPSLLIARGFGVPSRGDPGTLVLLSVAFLLGAVATGILIASAVRTLQQALFVAFFVLFPILFLSGTITPIESMPPALQVFSLLSPLRHYMDALLGVFLKGVGLAVLWPQLLWMLGLGAALFTMSMIVFRRRLV